MDPNQPDNNSFGGPTDAPTPEVAPTPDVVPTPEQAPVPAPAPEPMPEPTPEPEPTPSEPPVADPVQADTPSQPVDTAQPIEQPEMAPIAPEAAEPVAPVDMANPTEPEPTLTPSSEPVPTPEATPMPVVPESPAQPVGGDTASPTAAMPIGAPSKSKKGLIIGLVAGIGGLVIIGVVLFLLLVVFNGGGQIKNYAEFKNALDNHKAMNCDVTVSQEGASVNMTIRADNGWNKVYMSIPSLMETWRIKEGDKYTSYAIVMGQYVKGTQSASEFDESAKDLVGEDTLSEDKTKLDCKPNNQADFNVPDEDWKEATSSNLPL
jgi:hypothetical protein